MVTKAKQQLHFKVVITQDEDGIFVVDCPAIPGCHSQGDTHQEALKNIHEAIELCLEVAADDPIYRRSIDFGQTEKPRFIGISDITVPQPQYI